MSLPTAGLSQPSATIIPTPSPKGSAAAPRLLSCSRSSAAAVASGAPPPIRCTYLVLTDVPLDLPVDELITDDAVRPSFEDRQIAASGIASSAPPHAAKAHPELWANADRAQYVRRVYGSRQPAGTVAWRYQVAGQGEKPALTFAPSHTPADVVQAFRTDRLGPLAIFERAKCNQKVHRISSQKRLLLEIPGTRRR